LLTYSKSKLRVVPTLLIRVLLSKQVRVMVKSVDLRIDLFSLSFNIILLGFRKLVLNRCNIPFY